jgi:hypothetical protein
MKPFCLLLLLSTARFLAFSQAASRPAAASRPIYKTFAEQKTRFGLHRTAKATYTIERVPDSLISREEDAEPTHARTAATVYYPSAVACTGNTFAGEKRAVAKTHEASSTPSDFKTFDSFFASGLIVNDAQMRGYNPPITESSTSPRVKEEQVNVTIETVYIYGIYREDDNDFHMIIGNGKTGSGMHILNAEVSGLPGTGNDVRLTTVRNKIIARFGDLACGSGAYKPVNAFIPVKITGSLFFDVDHGAGKVGFQSYKPKTAWEIHPITDIQFLDE